MTFGSGLSDYAPVVALVAGVSAITSGAILPALIWLARRLRGAEVADVDRERLWTDEGRKLRDELRGEIAALRAEVNRLHAQLELQDIQIAGLQQRNRELEGLNEGLRVRIFDLEALRKPSA